MKRFRNIIYIPVLLTALLSGATICAIAQDEIDALRYSQLSPQGTARSIGIGSALGSIGGDFTTLSVNPAGLGIYRSSEITITPSLKLNGVNSTYTGASMSENATRFTINNFGAVFTNAAQGQRYERSNWKSVSFGIGINRLADFNRNYIYEGTNNTSTASEVFIIDELNFPGSINDINTPAGLGYNSYLLNDDSLGVYTVVPWQSGINQRRNVKERGGISEIAFSLGGNYQEKLFLGATIGLPSLRYRRESVYTEEDLSGNPDNDFDYFDYTENLETSGLGVNLKLGFIYKPADNFRFGAAFHTPTYFGLTDVYNVSVTSNTENLKTFFNDFSGPVTRVQAAENVYDYGITTPWRGVISAAAFFGKFGFITADYEYVNYASARYRFDGANSEYERIINQSIKNTYQGASNIRIGAEGVIDRVMLRLGFGYYGNPYQNQEGQRTQYSAGVGYRFDQWFLDLGFRHTRFEVQEQPYTLEYPDFTGIGTVPVPKATLENGLNNLALTLGFKF